MVGLGLMSSGCSRALTHEEISFDSFQLAVKEQRIKKVSIGELFIEGTYEKVKGTKPIDFYTHKMDVALAKEFDSDLPGFSGTLQNSLFSQIYFHIAGLLTALVLLTFKFRMPFFERFFQKRAELQDKKESITFEDVAGLEEVKAETKEIIQFLQDPKKFRRLGARAPTGVLLAGPPGNGKTLLAKAIAGESGVPFYYFNGSDLSWGGFGNPAKKISELFKKARRHKAAIVFIDEIDACGRKRSSEATSSGAQAYDNVVNVILSAMQGFESGGGVVTIGATNRPDILDPALVRPGRFDRHVFVSRPDLSSRKAILDVHLKKIKANADLNVYELAKISAGFSGAHLAAWINEAAIVAAHRSAETVEMADFQKTFDRIIAGLEQKGSVLSESEKRTVAYHEAGHAICIMADPHSTTSVRKISIVPQAQALGLTFTVAEENVGLQSRRALEAEIVGLYGGREAEMLQFGEPTTGASNDLERITQIALDMVRAHGMARKENFLVESEGDELGYIDVTTPASEMIDADIRDLLQRSAQRARAILTQNKALLDEIAQQLLLQETIYGAALDQLRARVLKTT